MIKIRRNHQKGKIEMSIENLRNRALNSTNGKPQMKIIQISPMNITLGEIKEVLEANPNHPEAEKLREFYTEHIGVLSPETVVAVEKAVILGILDNANVTQEPVGISPDGREIVATKVAKEKGEE